MTEGVQAGRAAANLSLRPNGPERILVDLHVALDRQCRWANWHLVDEVSVSCALCVEVALRLSAAGLAACCACEVQHL